MREPTRIVEVRVDAPSGPAHEYRADADARVVRLVGTNRPPERRPVDWAVVPGTLTAAGGPLVVGLATDVPCSPGVRARARLIGMVTVAEERMLVAVLADDEAARGRETWRDLGAATLAELVSLLAPHGSGGDRVLWSDPETAARAVRDARQAARLARSEHHATRLRAPVWQAPRSGGLPGEPVQTEAESALRQLPQRFGEAVATLLVSSERILAFAPRPRGRRSVRQLVVRRAPPEEGLLVLTDQQLLWVRDVLTAPLDVVGYGYVARSVPLERLVGVAVGASEASVRLAVESRTAAGVSASLEVAFPAASVGLVREIEVGLRGFVEAGTPGALMRVADPAEDETDLAAMLRGDERAGLWAVEAWRRRLSESLAEGERIAVRAVVPAWASPDRRPSLWLVTTRRLLHLPGGAPDAQVRGWPCGRIAAVSLCRSVFESALLFEWDRGGEVVAERVVFPLVAAAPFTAVFVALRRVMVGRAAFEETGP